MNVCAGCGGQLTGRQRKWCSKDCQQVARKWDWVLETYGLTEVEYWVIYEHQHGKCPICERSLDAITRPPHIDHEHGAHVRGIVCSYCNTQIIGRLKDYQTAQRLATYLRYPPAVKALERKVIAPGRRPKRRRRRRQK